MLIRSTHSIVKTFVNDQYIDFELSFTGVDKISFAFVYKKSGATSWEQNAIIEISQPGFVCGNVVDRVVLESSVCNLRWYYTLNGIEYRDAVEVKIDPSFYSSLFVFYEDKTSQIELGSSGMGQISVLSDKRFGEDYYLVGDKLYCNGILIYSGVADSYVTSFTVSALRRFLIADSINNRLVEVDINGVVINSFIGHSPTYCEFNSTTGNVLLIDSAINDAKEIFWKLPSGTPSPSIGSIVWSYNTDYPAFPLTNPRSATYGVTGTLENIIISDSSVIKIDRDLATRTEYSSFEFKKKSGTNLYYPYSMMFSFEIMDDELFSSEYLGAVLNYSSNPTVHITYNRSLRDDSNLSTPEAIENALFYPVRPVISSTDDVNVTISMLNSDYLLKKTNDAYIADGRRVPVLDDLENGCARGDTVSDRPFWGMLEGYNRGIGTQSLVCITGQTLSVEIPYKGEKIGYKKLSSDIDPVYVKEEMAVDLVDVFSGEVVVCLAQTDFTEDETFSIQVPNATPESYLRSVSNGFHGHYLLKITVVESYYATNTFETKSDLDKTFYFYVTVFSFWWRQIFKEITIPQTPVTSDFDLFDYNQTLASFFDSHTCYPSFYRVVGTTTLTVTDAQKEKILIENAFALFSYYSGFCPGDSPLSNAFGFGAASYVAEKQSVLENVSKIDLEETAVTPRLPGLNAEYQALNLFNYNPGTVCSSGQYVRDLFPVMFSDASILKADWLEGGMMTVPVCGQLIAEDVYTLDGSQTLSFDIDAPDITIDSITLKGKYSNSDVIVPGDTKITLLFISTSVDIQEVTMGVSVDGCTYVIYNDPSGLMRQFIFSTPKTITDTSVVDGFVELTDSNQNKFVYYATRKVSLAQRSSSINNVIISVDRPGKLLKINYDLYSRYKFVPYGVALFLKYEGTYFNVTGSTSGDIGNVFSGLSKLMTLNYEKVITDEDFQRQKITIRIVLTSLITSETATQYEYTVFFRTPDLWDNKIDEEVAVLVSNQESEVFPARIVSEDKIYSIGTWDVSDFTFTNPRVLISFSSMSSSSTSESSSCSSSSSSVFGSSSSCSCSSSSSYPAPP